MKTKMFFMLGIVLFTLSSFTLSESSTKATDDVNTVPCKWRTVYTHLNGDVSYTEWTYGNCNRTESGKLIPIR
jgi:hypothetical protein